MSQPNNAYASNRGLPLTDSYNSLMMSPQARFAGVYLSDAKYNIISQVTALMGESKQVTQRKIERSTLGKLGITGTVKTRGTSGTSLVLDLYDSTAEQVRVNDLVRASNGSFGKVSATQPGQVTITPWTDANGNDVSAFVSADFVADATFSVQFDASPNYDSRDKSSLTYLPTNDYNYIGVVRDAVTISRDELHTGTYELFKDGKFWAFAQEDLMRQRFAKDYEKRYLNSPRKYDGKTSTPGGLMPTIRRVGNYFPSVDASFTQNKLHDILETMTVNVGSSFNELLVLTGSRWLRNFQENIGDKYIIYVGKSNTIGGQEVKGIDVYEYSFLGKSLKIVPYPILDDDTVFPERSTITGALRSSSTALFLNTSPIETTQGMLPAFECFHKDSMPIRYFYQRGVIGVNDIDPSAALKSGEYVLASNDRDSFTASILADTGCYWNGANRHGLYELIA